ncbi:MAG TPA: thiamine phosphate synthase [Pyrinomonadaceae bacterium]|jgi:thiamine-phosphate pyrophosphorylase|nr:thiamine phosphate synthase [Pyrinomonadaceae bacterium]
MAARFPCQTYLITDGSSAPETFSSDKENILALVQKAVDRGISMVQIREKRLTAGQVFELAAQAAAITSGSSTKLLVNDRADIAFAAGADGVHLTSTSLPVPVIRDNFPAEFMIGVSTHSPEKAESAKSEGANFITFSPIFPTQSKINYGEPQGLQKLAAVVKALNGFPVFALGGINEKNYAEVLPTGAAGIAGISMFYEMLKGDDKL